MRRIFAGLVAAVAVVAGRHQISEVDGVKWVQRFRQIVVVGRLFTVIFTQQIIDAAELVTHT